MNDPMDYPRIRDWVEEWGGDVDFVDYVKCNGDLAMLVAYSEILWPTFIQVGACVLWDRVYEEENFNRWFQSLSGDARKIEATLNQLRVWDVVDSDDSGEDLQALSFVAARVAKMWRAALCFQYPGREFDVRVIESDDGPVVTFSSVL